MEQLGLYLGDYLELIHSARRGYIVLTRRISRIGLSKAYIRSYIKPTKRQHNDYLKKHLKVYLGYGIFKKYLRASLGLSMEITRSLPRLWDT